MDNIALTGRSATMKQAIESLTATDRSGCLIFGDAGMGKTTLVRALRNVLEREHPLFIISGTPALSTLEFAAFAPFLSGATPGQALSQQQVFSEISRFFRLQRAERGRVPIVIVDDAHDLDPGSLTLLARLVAGETVRILVLSPRSSMPAEFMELWADGFLDRCNLEPLNPDEVHTVCEEVLQGQVLQSVSAMVADMSGGNPLCITALLQNGRGDGSLFERNGTWLSAAAPCTDEPYSTRVRGSLARRPADEFELLEAVALTEPVTIEMLKSSGSPSNLDNLEMLGLVSISREGPRLVRLTNAVFSDVLRRTLSPARSSELRAKYWEPLDHVSSEQLVRRVSWALDCGGPLSPQVLVRAARAGNEEFDFRFTLRVAAAAKASEDLDELLLETAIAHAHLGHRFVAKDQLERVLAESENLPVLVRALVWICQLRKSSSAPGQQPRLAPSITGLSDRISRLRAAYPFDTLMDTITVLADVLHYSAERKSPELGEALNLMAWNMPAVDIKTRVVCLTMLGNLLNGAGQYNKGNAATSLALDLVQENPRQLAMESDFVYIHHVKGLLLGGRWDEAAVRLTDYLRVCTRNMIYSGAAAQLLQGALAVGQGRVKAGLQQLRPAIEGIRHGHFAELLPFGLGIMTYAAALCGEADFVDECTESFPQEGTCSDPGLFLSGKAYLVAAMAAIQRTDDGGRQLRELAEQAGLSGFRAAQGTALTLAVRTGHVDSGHDLMALTSTMDGPMAHVLQLYSRAVVAGDSDALLQSAAAARREGFHLLAVDCAEQAAAVLDTPSGRPRRSAAQSLLRQYRTLLDGPYVLGTYESSRAGRLTTREREIVALAQRGQSNRDIARTLSVSARTVEGHLYRIFAKLGVNSRAELLASAAFPELHKV